MTWFRVDDKFHDSELADQAGAALRTWVRCGSWSADQETDGHVPERIVKRYGSMSEAKRLVAIGEWIVSPLGGFQWVDWAASQRTKAQLAAEREKWRAKKASKPGSSPGESMGDSTESPSGDSLGESQVGGSGTSSFSVPGSSSNPPPFGDSLDRYIAVLPDALRPTDDIGRQKFANLLRPHIDRGMSVGDVRFAMRANLPDPIQSVPGLIEARLSAASPSKPYVAPADRPKCSKHSDYLPCRGCASDAKAAPEGAA